MSSAPFTHAATGIRRRPMRRCARWWRTTSAYSFRRCTNSASSQSFSVVLRSESLSYLFAGPQIVTSYSPMSVASRGMTNVSSSLVSSQWPVNTPMKANTIVKISVKIDQPVIWLRTCSFVSSMVLGLGASSASCRSSIAADDAGSGPTSSCRSDCCSESRGGSLTE